MKKLNQYALLSAMMLTGAVGFTACSSDNDPAGDVNIGNGEVVKTQFAINIPYAGKGNTRMDDETVQTSPDQFRGMTNIRLMPLALTENVDKGATGSENVNGSTIILGNIDKTSGTSGLQGNANYRIYNNVSIPLGTNAFLFYGEALSESNVTSATNGKLNTTPDFGNKIDDDLELSKISFSLQSIVEAGNTTITTEQDALAEMLTEIANVHVAEDETKTWANTANDALKTMYNQFISLQAGSANSILLTVQDLYNHVSGLTLVEGNDETKIKEALMAKIGEYFFIKGTAPSVTLTYRSGTTYPIDQGLPCGSVRVLWKDNAFSYPTPIADQNTENSNPLNVAGLSAYTYPSALFYMANTSIKTANKEKFPYSATEDWNAILEDYENGTTITNDTRSVALVSPINYAVGRFDVRAKFTNATVKDATLADVTISNEGFPFTGVLIGGQKNVNWNFLPDEGSEFTIFDKVITGTDGSAAKVVKIGTDFSDFNKTLVLSSADGTNVHFALELKNTGEQFVGIDGIVHENATFYLIGELKPGKDKEGVDHASIFEKDYVTTANVTINSLQKAYNCVPDLRTPKLELGLSVDLDWKEGVSHEVTIE